MVIVRVGVVDGEAFGVEDGDEEGNKGPERGIAEGKEETMDQDGLMGYWRLKGYAGVS
jgi:hypothetical protein